MPAVAVGAYRTLVTTAPAIERVTLSVDTRVAAIRERCGTRCGASAARTHLIGGAGVATAATVLRVALGRGASAIAARAIVQTSASTVLAAGASYAAVTAGTAIRVIRLIGDACAVT